MRQIGVATKPRNSVDIREEKIFTLPKVPDAWHNRIDQNSSVPEAIYHACVGIKNVWARERIIKLHVIGCSIFVCLGLLLDFDLLRWAITTLGAGLLILSEMLNTAVERIADM
ncbi:MAG TPA: diacylglycerol kinase, partial [Candidatus Obscuribacterales bacterium]